MKRSILLGLALVAIGGCGGTRAPSDPMLLEYDPTLVAAGFPNPVARLSLGRDTTWFIFDTAAGVHTLTSWFVERTGLALDPELGSAVSGVDATGSPVELQAVRAIALRHRGGMEIELDAAMVAEFPAEFEERGIGGLLNPRLLAPDGLAAVLDLRVPELRFEPFDDAVERLGALALPADEVRVCSEADAPIPNVVYAVRTRSGDRAGWVDLDSGATRTDIVAGSELIRERERVGQGTSMGVAGRERSHPLVADLPLTLGGREARVEVAVAEDRRRCGEDGRLGLDVMGRCAFVFGPDALAITCAG